MDHLPIVSRSIYHIERPAFQNRDDVNPTILVSWWCTMFSLAIILIRILGRYIRTERLFREDKIMLYSLIPLMIRMALVHVILIWGTNNVDTTGFDQIHVRHHEIGSKLVLAARIFYALFIWIAKFTVLEFLKRIISASWVKSYEIGLRLIYGFLVITFIAVVIGTLAECQPFDHYWQVVPDPGPKCREGLVQLIVMGVCDMVTDVVLVIFPIPLIFSSTMPLQKKLSLIALFLWSIVLIAITAYRIPTTIDRRSSQPYRSLLASLEILAATIVSNAVVIGSFIRDKGVKKAKFRNSIASGATPTLSRVPTRTETMTTHHWGSDEDLVKGMGVALPPLLRSSTAKDEVPRATYIPPNPIAEVVDVTGNDSEPRKYRRKWSRKESESSVSSVETDIKLRDLRTQLEQGQAKRTVEFDLPSSNKMSFFDMGDLVDNPEIAVVSASTSRRPSINNSSSQLPPAKIRSGSRAFLSDIGGMLSRYLEEEDDDEIRPVGPKDPEAKKRRMSKSPERKMRRFSRSPRPSKVQEEDIGSIMKKNSKGPDDLSFGDIGGLLK